MPHEICRTFDAYGERRIGINDDGAIILTTIPRIVKRGDSPWIDRPLTVKEAKDHCPEQAERIDQILKEIAAVKSN